MELVNDRVLLYVKMMLGTRLDRVCCEAGRCYELKAGSFDRTDSAVDVVSREGLESIAREEEEATFSGVSVR